MCPTTDSFEGLNGAKSTVVTGGVMGEKLVVVPFSVMRFGTEREITLAYSESVYERNSAVLPAR